MIVAGIDEAGYGPLLGPLVVSAAGFELAGVELDVGAEMGGAVCLWKLLKGAVAKKSPVKKGRVLVADSKIVHAQAEGVRLLERGVLAFFGQIEKDGGKDERRKTKDEREGGGLEEGCVGEGGSAAADMRAGSPRYTGVRAGSARYEGVRAGSARYEGVRAGGARDGGEAWCGTARELVEMLGCVEHGLGEHPWYGEGGQGARVPWVAEEGDLGIATNMVAGALAAAGVRVACMRTRVVSEGIFNRLVGQTQNKATAAVSVTLDHLHYLHQAFGERGLFVGIDKQGGRDFYREMLMRWFPEAKLKVLAESAKSSGYVLREAGAGGEKVTVVYFREKGDRGFFATALASMICKYLRELCMHSFNAWWCGRVEGLRPTAGYYGDGTRWLMEVEPHLGRLGVERGGLVRCR